MADEAIPRLYGLRDGDLANKADLYTDGEKKTSATYNEFRRPNGTEDGIFMALDGLDACAVVCSFGDSTERRAWTHDQIKAIERLGPHLRQFARSGGRSPTPRRAAWRWLWRLARRWPAPRTPWAARRTRSRPHLKRVYRKLGVRKQGELVRRVMSLGALRQPLS